MIHQKSVKSRNACPWRVSKALAVKADGDFLSNRPCEELNKKGTSGHQTRTKFTLLPGRLFFLYHTRTLTTTFIAYVYEAKIETLRCTTTVHLENETGF